jgi:putative ABC transport system permease protein
MITYYFRLALMRLRRNIWLTALIVAAIAVGIGSSMTVFTVLYTLAADPMPWKSSRLFAPSLDTNDPRRPRPADFQAYISAGLFSYPDAMAISNARQALHQAAMFSVSQTVKTGDPSRLPVVAEGQATQSDFFTMFDVPFRYGSAWGRQEDDSRANVIVISESLAAHFFPGVNPVGRTLQLGLRDFQIVGVTAKWAPFPAFYDPLGVTDAAKVRSGPEFFLPIESAVAQEFPPVGSTSVSSIYSLSSPAPSTMRVPGASIMQIYYSFPGFLQTQLWIELRSAADAQRYKQTLDGYAAEFQRHGGFAWRPTTALRSMREWLLLTPQSASLRREYGLAAWVAFGFLLVCLANAAALMLARFARRNGDLGVRRALGASRAALVAQCLVESGVIGGLGGLLGLLITLLGLQLERASVPREMVRAVHLDWQLVVATLALAITVGVGAGLYPAWRASLVRGTLELKSL